jgi:pSer/pThr/pTyr-binding forkhead associated (FHA) protein
MPSPRFPAAATLLDAKVCPLDRFDALFAKITQERQITDGYFLQVHPDEAMVLFIVNACPFAAGCLAGEKFASREIHEFFAAYARHPESPLSFFVADKRLLLGLMVLFRHQAAQQFTTDIMAMQEVLGNLATREAHAILGIGSGGEWAIGIVNRGRLIATYFPPSGAAASQEPTPADQLLAYARTRPPGEVAVEVFDETRVVPAGDATLVTPETRGRLSEVFLKVAAKVQEQEEEAAPRLELEVAFTPEVIAPPDSTPTVEPVSPTEPAPSLSVEGEGSSVSAEDATAPPEGSTASREAAPAAAPEPSPSPVPKGPAPEIQVIFGDKLLGTFSLATGELTIGRNPGNDIMIENAGVSRRHAVIRWTGERATLEDRSSANGTFVNGKKVTSQDLRDGDEIMIVKYRLIFRLPKEGEIPKVEAAAGQKTMYIDPAAIAQAMGGISSPRSEAATPVLRPRLILPDLKKFALETDEVTLGSGAECQIQLPGMFVAKVHARIVPQKDEQYKIVHIAGLAGTRVNGEKITAHVLKHGDEIEIGKSKLLFRLER